MVHLHPMWTRGAVGFQQPKLYIIATLSPIPKSIQTALADPHWWVATEEEYAAFMSNSTWDLVSRLHDANIVTDKWILNTSSRLTGHSRGTMPAGFFVGSRSIPASIMMRLPAPL
jgi:hypothetical protein